jgi:hypothetical protein
MSNPYDLHSWSKHYPICHRPLGEVTLGRLRHRLLAKQRGLRQVGLGWATVLAPASRGETCSVASCARSVSSQRSRSCQYQETDAEGKVKLG